MQQKPNSKNLILRKTNFNTKWVINLLFSLVILLGCDEQFTPTDKVTPSVKVFKVGKQSSGQSRRISGKVKAADQSSLSFGVGGKVLEVIAKNGQTVIQGQVLAQLDEEPFKLSLNKARASLNSARSKLVVARSTFKRTRGLVKLRGASQKDLDTAIANLGTATSDVNSARDSLKQAEIDLSRTKLIAPFTGKVVDAVVDSFQEVTANEEAFILQSSGALKVDVLVPETLIRDVDFGQLVQVTFPTLKDLVVSGEVITIGAQTESGNAFPVTVLLADSESDLRPGMTASVTFNFNAYLGQRTAFLIPLSAIAIDASRTKQQEIVSEQSNSGKQAPVFVYDSAASRIQLRQVTIGDLRGNEIEVFEGLKTGDQVVSAGVAFIRDGMQAVVWKPRK